MPRKKDPPPSALPLPLPLPRRSTRSSSRLSPPTDGDDFETLVVPIVGLGHSQEGLRQSTQPPPLVLVSDACKINKEVSDVPTVSVSLEDSKHDMGSNDMSGTLKQSMGAVEICSAGKSASAGGTCSPGLSVSGSSGSPVIQPKLVENVLGSGSSKETSGFGYAENTGSTPPATPLFSPEFKAMLSRTYLTTVLARGSLSGEGKSGHGRWGAMNRKAQTQVVVGPMNMPVADPVINLHEQEGSKLDPSTMEAMVHAIHTEVHESMEEGSVSQEEVVNNMHADDLVVGQEDGAAFHANIDAGVVSNMEQTNTGVTSLVVSELKLMGKE
ncbi:hypothetical protein L1987_65065 [Smallanthus sonchifolius]|uniref:Uncharacterized protein n=1 Tax=Smallanthus sonchifolius TaxID=185202 RepID=A0ACB9BTB1_9ASTR|nr:hypothetical protein L1987_65065 [Smallanthus sonchifolius]